MAISHQLVNTSGICRLSLQSLFKQICLIFKHDCCDQNTIPKVQIKEALGQLPVANRALTVSLLPIVQTPPMFCGSYTDFGHIQPSTYMCTA